VHEPTAAAKGHTSAGDSEAPDEDAEETTSSEETPASPAAPMSEPEDGAASNGKVN
jgi:hypothetical protein